MRILIVCTIGCCLLSLTAFAQKKKEGVDTLKKGETNFFTHVHKIKEELGNDKGEGSYKGQLEKMERAWGERLFPSGLAASMTGGITEYVRKFNTNTLPTCVTGNWTALGPIGRPAIGDGGRGVGQIHCLKFSPNFATDATVYAASNWGGLWRRVGTNPWQVVGTDLQLAFTSVSDIAIHPTNPQVIYITTGEAESHLGHYASNPNAQPSAFTPLFTAGVYRSTNGGTTWVNINGTNQALLDNFTTTGGTIRRVLLNPNNPQ
jgi:hypothetical protein